MRKSYRSLALAVVGVIVIASSATGQCLTLVPDASRWGIIGAGVLMIALAVVSAMRDHHVASAYRAVAPAEPRLLDAAADRATGGAVEGAAEGAAALSRSARRAAAAAAAHAMPRQPRRLRVGWGMVVPFVAFAALAPGPLGAYAGARGDGSVASLPTGGQASSAEQAGPVGPLAEMTLTAYSRLALSASAEQLRARTVLLTGFVLPGNSSTSWYLTRLVATAGAADARPVRVEVRSAVPAATGTWVGVLGTWPGAPGGTVDAPLAVIEATTVTPIVEPGQPYENPRP